MLLKKANQYGNVDIIDGVPAGYGHVSGRNLQPLCRKMGIKFAPAVVGFTGSRRYGYQPVKDGVVVSAKSAPKLEAALAERDARTAIRPGDTSDPAQVLRAVFSVNRSAKRHRDAASTHYSDRMHGFAGDKKRQKLFLYGLKDRGIVAAYHHGWLRVVGMQAGLCLYQGHGYSFHSPLCPVGVGFVEDSQDRLFVEAKPRSSREMRLKDAIATLQQLPADCEGFIRRSVPARHRWSGDGDFLPDDDDFPDDDESSFDRCRATGRPCFLITRRPPIGTECGRS